MILTTDLACETVGRIRARNMKQSLSSSQRSHTTEGSDADKDEPARSRAPHMFGEAPLPPNNNNKIYIIYLGKNIQFFKK